jgi:hypothetical protein
MLKSEVTRVSGPSSSSRRRSQSDSPEYENSSKRSRPTPSSSSRRRSQSDSPEYENSSKRSRPNQRMMMMNMKKKVKFDQKQLQIHLQLKQHLLHHHVLVDFTCHQLNFVFYRYDY